MFSAISIGFFLCVGRAVASIKELRHRWFVNYFFGDRICNVCIIGEAGSQVDQVRRGFAPLQLLHARAQPRAGQSGYTSQDLREGMNSDQHSKQPNRTYHFLHLFGISCGEADTTLVEPNSSLFRTFLEKVQRKAKTTQTNMVW